MAADAGPSLAVVLFTDLVGSTAQRAALGEERADELRQVHDRLLGERIEAHTGRVVKGLGDGLMAAFASASDALTAAVEAQQAVHAYNQRPDAIAALSVRMGLSVGDVSWEDGECFGTPAVEAARLVAMAEGSQIVCSDFVRVMAKGRGGHRFRALGPMALKGLPEPLEACEVEWDVPDDRSVGRLPFPRALVVRSPTPFVGREAEVAEAERYLERSDGFALLWLAGEPGIGKSRLAAELARRAYDRGWDVLAGRCDEDLAVPFQPFLHALRDFVDATPDAALPDRLGRQPSELARLLPDLSRAVPGPAAPATLDPTIERFRLFEAVRSWLLTAAAARPLLLILDDVHWADAATVQLLGYLARAADPVRVRVVATRRDTETETPELRHLLDDGGAASSTIGLRGLSGSGVSRLVEAATGRSSAWDPTGIAHRIETETGGNPLFIVAVLAGLDADGTVDDLPGDVTAAVRRRVRGLPEPARDLLRVGALAGLEFDLRVVCRVLELSIPDAFERIEPAARSHVVEEIGVNQYRFTHALVRAALNRELGPSRAAHYHLLVAEATETLYSHRLLDHVDELAHHYGEAVACGGPLDRAVEYAVAAAGQADARFAYTTAAEHYQRAVQLLEADRQAGTRRHCELLVQLGKAQFGAFTFDEARATLRRVLAEAEAAGYTDLMAGAACDFERATTFPAEPAEEAVDLVERAVRRLDPGDSDLRAGLLTSLGRALGFTARGPEGLAALQEAIAMAKRVGNDRVLHLALWSLANTVMDPRQYDVRLRAALEAVELASRTGDRFAPLYAAAVVFDVRLEAGDIREIEAAFHRWQEVDRDVLWLWDPFFLQVVSAMLAFLRGRLPEAEKLTVAAHEIGRGLYGIDPDGPYSLQMFTIRREQGRLREIAPALQTMVELGVAQETWRPGLAALWADLGLVTEAQAELAALIPRAQVLIPRDSRLAISLSYLSDAAVLVGDQERAEVLYRELLPYAALCITGLRIACYGPASRYLGMLATTLGRFDDAQEHFEDALLRCDRLESPVWTAHTQYHFARMLLTRRRPADVAQAELLARAARQTAAAIGMRSLQDRVGRLLESGLGVGHNDD